MTTYIAGVDIGTVQSVSPIYRRGSVETRVGGGLTYWQNTGSPSVRWSIYTYLKSPTQTQLDAVLNLQHGLPVLVDLESFKSGFITWGRVAEVKPSPLRVGGLVYLDILVNEIPGIGTTYVQTDGIYLHDLQYQSNQRVFNPLGARYNKSVTGDRLDWTWEFYLDNDTAGILTAVIEFQVGDDVDKLKVWGWKGGAWSLIGDWGGADAWNADKNFVDDGTITHVCKFQEGNRGAVLAGIGTISQMLGTYRRVLGSITLLSAHIAPDLSTDVSLDQILLKVTAEHTLREAARPYPVITYVDGSLDYGIA